MAKECAEVSNFHRYNIDTGIEEYLNAYIDTQAHPRNMKMKLKTKMLQATAKNIVAYLAYVLIIVKV